MITFSFPSKGLVRAQTWLAHWAHEGVNKSRGFTYSFHSSVRSASTRIPASRQIPHPLRRRPPRRDPPPPGTRRSLLPFLAHEPILPRDPLISPGIWIGRRTRSFIFVRKRGRAVWIACVVGGAWCARSALARLRFDSIAVDVMRLSIGGVACLGRLCALDLASWLTWLVTWCSPTLVLVWSVSIFLVVRLDWTFQILTSVNCAVWCLRVKYVLDCFYQYISSAYSGDVKNSFFL